jgi:hypothetical protein
LRELIEYDGLTLSALDATIQESDMIEVYDDSSAEYTEFRKGVATSH